MHNRKEIKIGNKHFFLTFLFFFFLSTFLSAKEVELPFPKWWEPAGLELFKKAYPDLKFISSYDVKNNDWIIHVIKKVSDKKKAEIALYWCDSRFLPEEKLPQKENYRRMIYRYEIEVPDPEKFTEDDIKLIKDFTSSESRSKGPVDPPFLYNFIYDCENRNILEEHIEKISFLGKTLNVHERIVEALSRVEGKINALERTEELEKFLSTLDRVDCYNWRTVRDTENRSFHSLGLAIDVLPKGYYQKSIYWGWQRQWDPDYWWKTSLKKRWMPPESVIRIFREEGFIWGGTWIVWDNMHFEYRPELLVK